MVVDKLKQLCQVATLPDLRQDLEDLVANPVRVRQVIQASQNITVDLVMLVRDQVEVIEDVLRPLLDLSLDHYHIIDTGSTDGTYEKLQHHEPIKLHRLNWVEDFAYMRNQAAKFSTADWVLVIDSDELFQGDIVDLRLLISALTTLQEGDFTVAFQQHLSESGSFQYKTVLYQPHQQTYSGLVHEEVRHLVTKQASVAIPLGIKLYNKGSEPSEQKRFDKVQRYARLLDRMQELEPDNPRWLSLLSRESIMALTQEGRYESMLRRHLLQNDQSPPSIGNLKQHPYTKVLLERYIVHLIGQGRLNQAMTIQEMAATIFSESSRLKAYRLMLEFLKIKAELKRILTYHLESYLSLDQVAAYESDNQDSQLYEVLLAACYRMLGQDELSSKIEDGIWDPEIKAVQAMLWGDN